MLHFLKAAEKVNVFPCHYGDNEYVRGGILFDFILRQYVDERDIETREYNDNNVFSDYDRIQ